MLFEFRAIHNRTEPKPNVVISKLSPRKHIYEFQVEWGFEKCCVKSSKHIKQYENLCFTAKSWHWPYIVYKYVLICILMQYNIYNNRKFQSSEHSLLSFGSICILNKINELIMITKMNIIAVFGTLTLESALERTNKHTHTPLSFFSVRFKSTSFQFKSCAS